MELIKNIELLGYYLLPILSTKEWAHLVYKCNMLKQIFWIEFLFFGMNFFVIKYRRHQFHCENVIKFFKIFVSNFLMQKWLVVWTVCWFGQKLTRIFSSKKTLQNEITKIQLKTNCFNSIQTKIEYSHWMFCVCIRQIIRQSILKMLRRLRRCWAFCLDPTNRPFRVKLSASGSAKVVESWFHRRIFVKVFLYSDRWRWHLQF